VSEDQGSLQSKSQRLAIAAAIQHHLDAHGLARKDLIRDYLSKSTIDKLFQGEFSERTLTKIEAILNIALTPKHAEDDQAPSQIGGYTLQAVDYLQGDYLCVRPLFTDPTNLNAYLIRIAWDGATRSLRFEELSRRDAKYAQKGTVYIPFGTPFLNLVSTHLGNLRTVLLSLPDGEGVCRGLITTLSISEGNHVHAGRSAGLPAASCGQRAAGGRLHQARQRLVCALSRRSGQRCGRRVRAVCAGAARSARPPTRGRGGQAVSAARNGPGPPCMS